MSEKTEAKPVEISEQLMAMPSDGRLEVFIIQARYGSETRVFHKGREIDQDSLEIKTAERLDRLQISLTQKIMAYQIKSVTLDQFSQVIVKRQEAEKVKMTDVRFVLDGLLKEAMHATECPFTQNVTNECNCFIKTARKVLETLKTNEDQDPS